MRKKQIIMAVILGLGVILRLFALGSQSVWRGEFLTAWLSTGQNIFYVFFNSVLNSPHPPLFYMLEHITINIFGTSDASIRLLPALIGIINIFIFFRLARSFFNEKASTIAVFLFALNPFLIYYSQEAGPFSLFLMTSMLVIYYFLMSVKYNSFLFGPFILWSVIGVYTHENAMILFLTLNFIIFVTNRKDIRLLPWAIAQGIILAAWLPLLLLSMKPSSAIVAAGLSASVSAVKTSAFAPLYSIKAFLFGTTIALNWFVIICIAICLVFAALGVISKRKATEKRLLDAIAIIIIMLLAGQWLISFIQPGSYADSGLMNSASLILLVLAVGVSYMSDQGLVAFTVLIGAVYGMSLFNYFFRQDFRKTDYKAVFRKVRLAAADGSLIIHTSGDSYSAFEFYDKYEKKTGFINRLRSEPQESTVNVKQAGLINMRKNIRENLKKAFKFDISDGYSAGMIGQDELKNIIGSYRRVFLVEDNISGMKQPYLAQESLWNLSLKFDAPPEPEKIWWIKEYFNIKEKISVYGCDAYVLEKK